MKKYFKLLTIFAFTFMGAASAFAAVSDTFTATQTQAYTAEVKASATLEFTGGAIDGSHITIGDCRIDFDSSAVADDNDCSDNTAVTASFATPAELNTFFDSLTNVTDNVVWGTYVPHGALSVVDVDGTHTQFITAGAEIGDGHLYISGAHGNLSISTRTAGVVKKPQILTFTPTNISPEGGVRFGAHVGNAWHFYTTSVANHTVKDIVEALQPGLNGEAGFTCTENDVRIECTATDDQSHGFGAQVEDIEEPSVSGNINVHVNENTTGTAVDIPSEVTITDADHLLTFSIINTSKDHASFTVAPTGELSFVNRPDYENPGNVDGDNVYEVSVNVEDEAGNGQGINIQITIDNIDEVPVIGNANIGSRDEDLAVGSQIYDVNDFYSHTDNDGDGDPITYAITGGNTGNVFTIDPATGVVTLVAPLDFETTNSYHVTISGTSTTAPHAALTGNGGFWMTVNDIQEPSHHSNSRRVSKKKLAEIFGKAKKEVKEETKEEAKETTPACGFVYSRLIKYGTHGEDVKALQTLLNSLGYNTGIADGWYGPKTLKGIKAFQTAMNIRVDGVFGPQSNLSLMQKCSA